MKRTIVSLTIGLCCMSGVTMAATVPTPPSTAHTNMVINTMWLPETVTAKASIPMVNATIRQTIIDAYQIPPTAWEQTFYQYNRVEIHGKPYMMVMVMGPWTSGTGGDSLLLLQLQGSTWHIVQRLSVMRSPIVIASESGDLIYRQSGGGVSRHAVRIPWTGDHYDVSHMTAMTPMEVGHVVGTAYMSNDIVTDALNGQLLSLDQE